MKPIRWSDNDKYWGPFTYDGKGRDGFAIQLGSGCSDYPGCRLRISAFKKTLIVALPQIIKPSRRWVDTSRHEWSKPGGGYWDINEREYGFSYSEGFLNFSLGRQTHDSSTEQRKGYFIPWTQWRHVRTSYYDINGKHYFTEPKNVKFMTLEYDRVQAKTDACPSVKFNFKDYDGEELIATTKIREMEWKFGTGWFKWLSFFRKNKVRRSLDIQFSGETGRRKGSWKGGTIGHGIDIAPKELHAAAFRRYCNEHDMTFIGAA